jgi:hypothetical protein
MASLPKQVVGNAGLYLVCYELTKRGWNVLPTSRNAKGVDIVIYNQDASEKHTVQVKALSRRSAAGMGTSDQPLIADFLIVCTNVLQDDPRVFVLPGTEAARLVQASGTGSKFSCWLEPAAYEPFEDAWDLIGSCYED